MRPRHRRRDLSRHAKPCFEQRPVERFAIERDQYPPFGHAFRQGHEQRVFLAVLAHEKLFDFQASRVPPGDAYQKGIRSGAAHQPGCFGIQKKPLPRIAYQGFKSRRQQTQRRFIQLPIRRRKSDRLGKPFAHREMLAVGIAHRFPFQHRRKPFGSGGQCRRESPRTQPGFRNPAIKRATADRPAVVPRLQRRQRSEFVAQRHVSLISTLGHHPGIQPRFHVLRNNTFF